MEKVALTDLKQRDGLKGCLDQLLSGRQAMQAKSMARNSSLCSSATMKQLCFNYGILVHSCNGIGEYESSRVLVCRECMMQRALNGVIQQSLRKLSDVIIS